MNRKVTVGMLLVVLAGVGAALWYAFPRIIVAAKNDAVRSVTSDDVNGVIRKVKLEDVLDTVSGWFK